MLLSAPALGPVRRCHLERLLEIRDRPLGIPSFNGPLNVSGTFTLKDAVGQAFDPSGNTAVVLCRCGQSAKKPLCDGSHKAVGFQAPGVEPLRKP